MKFRLVLAVVVTVSWLASAAHAATVGNAQGAQACARLMFS